MKLLKSHEFPHILIAMLFHRAGLCPFPIPIREEAEIKARFPVESGQACLFRGRVAQDFVPRFPKRRRPSHAVSRIECIARMINRTR
jgi:hypothetical protein